MTRPIYEPSLQRTDRRLGYTSDQLLRRPAPTAGGFTPEWAILALPAGETLTNTTLTVVNAYGRSATSGDALTVNTTTGLITIHEKGIYDIHSWALVDNVDGTFDVVEGPVFQAGQDFQDIGNGLHTTRPNVNYPETQHETMIFVADLPQSINLQVAQFSGVTQSLDNGGLTVVKIGEYP